MPAVSLTDLPEAELRVLRLALNRISEDFRMQDREALTIEFSEILQLAPEIGLEVSGFEMSEIDTVLDDGGLDQEDEVPPIDAAVTPVSAAGRPLGAWCASPFLRRRTRSAFPWFESYHAASASLYDHV